MFALALGLPALGSDTGTPTPETLSAAYTGKVYSPYAKSNFSERPLWGSHLHTDLSMDAGLFGNRLSIYLGNPGGYDFLTLNTKSRNISISVSCL